MVFWDLLHEIFDRHVDASNVRHKFLVVGSLLPLRAHQMLLDVLEIPVRVPVCRSSAGEHAAALWAR